MSVKHDSQSRRGGVSSAEAIVATVVLSIAIACVGRFAAGVNRGLHEREVATRIGWQVQNARAKIAAWSYDEISPKNIKRRLTISRSLTEKLQTPSWQATVTLVNEPIPAKRVELSLTCTYNEQRSTPSTLTFWVPKPKRESEPTGTATPKPDQRLTDEDSDDA